MDMECGTHLKAISTRENGRITNKMAKELTIMSEHPSTEATSKPSSNMEEDRKNSTTATSIQASTIKD